MTRILYPPEGEPISLLKDVQRRFCLAESKEEDTDPAIFDWKHPDDPAGVRSSDPEHLTVRFESDDPAPFLLLSESPDFRCARVIPCGNGEADLFNLKTRTVYYYKISDSEIRSFRTRDEAPRFLTAGKPLSNIRDLGGWYTEDGQRIRQNCLIRGCEMNKHLNITKEGIRLLRETVGVKTDLDLRGEVLGEQTESILGNDIRYVLIPMSAYAGFLELSDENRRRIKELFDVISDPSNYPIYFHCWGGADRTGCLSYLIEALLGVPESILLLDYDLTSTGAFGSRSRKSELFSAFSEAWLAFGDENVSPKERAEAFVKACGVTEETLEDLRRNLLEHVTDTDYFGTPLPYQKEPKERKGSPVPVRTSSPEAVGISSRKIEEFMRSLDAAHLCTHDVIIARGDTVVYETYLAPFHRDFLHRMYSVSKSYVTLAAGFAVKEGLFSLDDPVEKYFAKELEGQENEEFRRQTIRDMMKMATVMVPSHWNHLWSEDRVAYYFKNTEPKEDKNVFRYDSTGTFVVGALIERLTGMRYFDYLRPRLFDKLGISEDVYCIDYPWGHSWSDSAAMMRARDLYLTALFLLRGGEWNGEQLLPREFIKEITSYQISTNDGMGPEPEMGKDDPEKQGYGYYIWKAWGEGFYFNGMGCQYALCVPEKDLILIYNADNMGQHSAPTTVIGNFYNMIVKNAGGALPEDPAAAASLAAYDQSAKLMPAWGEPFSPLAEQISGKTFTVEENEMGLSSFSFTFDENGGVYSYTNREGRKEIPFGIGENRMCTLPLSEYRDEIGFSVGDTPALCAASGAWKTPDTFFFKFHLIHNFFGNVWAEFRFDGDTVSVHMKRNAEDCLNRFNGNTQGRLVP